MTPDEYRQSWNPSEKDFRQCVIDAARRLGGCVYFTQRSDRSPAGFPDLVIAMPAGPVGVRLLFVELKTNRGRLSIDQRAWLDVLRLCPGVETYVWRPQHWDQVLALLSGETEAEA